MKTQLVGLVFAVMGASGSPRVWTAFVPALSSSSPSSPTSLASTSLPLEKGSPNANAVSTFSRVFAGPDKRPVVLFDGICKSSYVVFALSACNHNNQHAMGSGVLKLERRFCVRSDMTVPTVNGSTTADAPGNV